MLQRNKSASQNIDSKARRCRQCGTAIKGDAANGILPGTLKGASAVLPDVRGKRLKDRSNMISAVDTNVLINDNQQLRAELHDFLEHARVNQQIMQRHQAFDLRLIGSSEFRDLIETVSLLMPNTFNLEIVTLTLIDHDFDIRRILQDLQIGLDEYPNLLFHVEGSTPLPQDKPTLGAYNAALHKPLFPSYQPASVAVLPLMRHQNPIGCLALGSAHEGRFTGNLATDFIERLASVVAICLENVINNERLKHIGLTDPLTGVN